ncbi:MAG TPA: protein kinase, partial [Anaeromyxobacteraceae bacterium]|nr:protein kinase [Anaeromyxobacteraceae bacterium]
VSFSTTYSSTAPSTDVKSAFHAGRLYEKAGELARAREAYFKGGYFKEAAAVCMQLGLYPKAAELYLRAEDPERAAGAHDKAGDAVAAANLRGEVALKGHRVPEAAAFFQQGRDYLRAAELYESVDLLAEAAGAYEAGESWAAAGNVYVRAGLKARAAASYERARDYETAARLFEEAGLGKKAIELYEKAGDLPAAANLRGEVALKEGQVPQAADFFQQGRDFLRSAELFESVGMLAQAAGAYEAGESWAAAGNVYVRAGLKEKAAQSYERAGDLETAARLYEEAGLGGRAIPLYEKAGFTFKSGESAARSGDRAKAIALLQRVAANDENYGPATELLARMFIEEGRPGLAVERVQKVLGGQPVSPGTLDLYYWLAVGLETAGKNSDALAIFRKVQSENLHYQDVGKRVARLEEGGTVPPLPPPPLLGAESPLPSAPAAAAPSAPAPPPAEAAAGGRGPRFLPREEIGRGPLGVVYRGEDSVDGRTVALRWIRPDLLGPDGLGRMGSDLKAAAGVSHPNLVKILGLVDLQGQRYVVTEHVAGRSFAEALAGGHKMSVKQVHSLGRVLAQVLSVIHAKGLVHGSIQPSNLMVANGVVKLADLGLGRLAHAHGPQPGYRAPENKLDVSGDVYALAGVLYHLLTGVHPRSQPQGAALPMPSTLATGVPEALDKLLLR